jgi:hypothetical protein
MVVSLLWLVTAHTYLVVTARTGGEFAISEGMCDEIEVLEKRRALHGGAL